MTEDDGPVAPTRRRYDRQDASAKPGHQVIFKPLLQLGAPLACRKNDKTSPQFADRHSAQIQRLFVLGIDPIPYAWLGTNADQFRRDVGVEQKTAHDRSTGRPVEGLRLKSTSSAKPLTISNTSRRLLPCVAHWSDWQPLRCQTMASLRHADSRPIKRFVSANADCQV